MPRPAYAAGAVWCASIVLFGGLVALLGRGGDDSIGIMELVAAEAIGAAPAVGVCRAWWERARRQLVGAGLSRTGPIIGARGWSLVVALTLPGASLFIAQRYLSGTIAAVSVAVFLQIFFQRQWAVRSPLGAEPTCAAPSALLRTPGLGEVGVLAIVMGGAGASFLDNSETGLRVSVLLAGTFAYLTYGGALAELVKRGSAVGIAASALGAFLLAWLCWPTFGGLVPLRAPESEMVALVALLIAFVGVERARSRLIAAMPWRTKTVQDRANSRSEA